MLTFITIATLAFQALSSAGSATAASNATNSSGLQPYLYTRFHPGAIKPTGWMLDQANIQANGLAGSTAENYSYVADSVWTGGTIEYSEMLEAAPYWFNGVVTLAYQLDNSRLKSQAKKFLDYVIAHQDASGWFGPGPFNLTDVIPGTPPLLWPRYMTMLGLIQYAEADSTQTDRIVTLLHNFLPIVQNLTDTGALNSSTQAFGFQFSYQYVRWEELVYTLQWLYDNHPQGKQAQLLNLMSAARDQGFSWKTDFFVDGKFPTQAETASSQTFYSHGVNLAEALKSEALAWRFTNDDTDRQNTYDRMTMVYKYHGRPQGSFSADEHLSGLGPQRGTELCTIVEQMFSIATMYQVFGEPAWADLVEQMAYNALPASNTPDFWQHQYLQQTNQIWAKNHTDGFPWQFQNTDDSYSNVFGLESNYPCCTVNHPQGYPKFWANSFVQGAGGSLVHAFLGPTTFSGVLGTSNKVKVAVDTLYPFGSTLSYTVSSSAAFAFSIRIPAWAQNLTSSIAVNGASAKPLSVDSATSLQTVNLAKGSNKIELSLDLQIRIESRSNGSVAIHRGPLLYAVDLTYNSSTSASVRSPPAVDFVVDELQAEFHNVPADDLTAYTNTTDITYLSTAPWNIAIDTSTLTVHDTSSNVSALPYYVWNVAAQPIYMTATACEIKWALANGDPDWPPASPNNCTGGLFNVTLRPYGGTRLRLAELPTMTV